MSGGTKHEFQEAFDQGFEAVKGYVDRSLDVLHERIKALEQERAVEKRLDDVMKELRAMGKRDAD